MKRFLPLLLCFAFGCTEEETCSLILSPEPGLEDLVTRVASRWTSATGCDVKLGDGGVGIKETEGLSKPDGTLVLGVYHCVTDDIEILASSIRKEAILVHEVGHALGNPDCQSQPHSDSGVMTKVLDCQLIDESSLNLVCSTINCPEYNPEGACE